MKWLPVHSISHRLLDPYFAWAERTGWRGFRRLLGQRLGTGDEPVDKIRLLVKAKNADVAREAMGWTDYWSVADVYKAWEPRLLHFVAELDIQTLPWLLKLPAEDVRWELALPFRDAETAARAQAAGAYGDTRDALSFRPDEFFNVQAPAGPSGKVTGGVIAVIDFGLPFINDAFLDAEKKKTRIAALWDQGAECNPPHKADGSLAPWPWADTTKRMGYGRLLQRSTIDKIFGAFDRLVNGGEPLDESEAYRRLDYLIDYDDARRRTWAATHGSHVASVAAGWPDPLLAASIAASPADRSGLDADARDAASSASLVFVQLPALTSADSGGGSLSAQVLDAVHFVLDTCDAITKDPSDPVVVTLSYGSFAGPHDGSSMIEQALDEILERKGDNVAIVVGAGNGRQAACHVARTVAVDRSALLRIGLDPGDFTDTYVETWFKPDEPVLGWVRARTRSSEGDWSEWVGIDQSTELRLYGEPRPVARLSFQRSVPNGNGPLLLLAVAPTDRPADDDGPLAPTGSWRIEIALEPPPGTKDKSAQVEFDAWIERDDPGWLGHGVQPRFEEQRVGDDGQTLSSLATGERTIAAGGFRLSDSRPANYSSIGSRKGPPVVYAACEESAEQPNIRAAAVRNGDSLRMNGTSVAAPVLARRVYNHLASLSPQTGHRSLMSVLRAVVSDERKASQQEGRACLLAHGLPPPPQD